MKGSSLFYIFFSFSLLTFSQTPNWQMDEDYMYTCFFDEDTEWELAVYDQSQLEKEKEPKIKGKEVKIRTAGWKKGIYYVRVKYKNEILTGKLSVEE